MAATAGTGPSGWRSSYIQLIACAPNGLATLALWASAWGSDGVDIQTATHWTSSLVRPFYKANGKDIRPVLCSETLFKYAVAAAMKANLPDMGPVFGPRQYGAGRVGGVEQEIYEVRASLRVEDCAHPDPLQQWGAVALDLTNAVGKVQWAHTHTHTHTHT